MRKSSLHKFSSYILAAFFVVGGVTNLFPSAVIAENYARWGYPDWFHYATGVLELTVAFMLALKKTRMAGCLLAITVMLSAIITLVVYDGIIQALLPFLVFCAASGLALTLYRTFNKKQYRPSLS